MWIILCLIAFHSGWNVLSHLVVLETSKSQNNSLTHWRQHKKDELSKISDLIFWFLFSSSCLNSFSLLCSLSHMYSHPPPAFLPPLLLALTYARVHRGAPGVDGNSSDGHTPPRQRLPEALRQPSPPLLHKQARIAGAPWLQRQSAGVPGGE